MKYRNLGKWGVKLSSIGLGSYLTIGYKLSEDVSRDTIMKAYDGGVNFFDTADVYNRGEAEKELGKYLSQLPRNTLVLLSKCYGRMSDDVNDFGLSAKHIREACEKSLARLKTDYLDIYLCHRPDPETPLEETIRAMEDLARDGKIIYWGVSEWPAHVIVRANRIAKEIGARPASASEPRYNLLYRYPERNLFPATQAEGIGNVTYSPLAHGMLTGKYTPGQPAPEGTRAADDETNTIIKKLYWKDENMEKGKQLASLASDMGCTAAQLAIAWCLLNPAVTSVITGATKVSQVEDNLKAADLELTTDVIERLEDLYPKCETVESEC